MDLFDDFNKDYSFVNSIKDNEEPLVGEVQIDALHWDFLDLDLHIDQFINDV